MAGKRFLWPGRDYMLPWNLDGWEQPYGPNASHEMVLAGTAGAKAYAASPPMVNVVWSDSDEAIDQMIIARPMFLEPPPKPTAIIANGGDSCSIRTTMEVRQGGRDNRLSKLRNPSSPPPKAKQR